jgi:DNA-binding transcriptional MerR regulator
MICTMKKGVSIGDAAKICGVESHTIRYWEKEFAMYLRPVRTRGQQRRYRDSDIGKLLHVKKLLWDERFTIEGAKRVLTGDSLFSLLAGMNVPQTALAPAQSAA